MKLPIELDSAAGFAPGVPISGRIAASPGATLAGQVLLRREEEFRGELEPVTAAQTPIDPDGSFRIVAEGPATYQGEESAVHWTLVAYGSVDGRPFEAERPIRLAQLPENRSIQLTEMSRDVDPFVENVATGMMLLVALFLALTGAWMLLAGSIVGGIVLTIMGVGFGAWSGRAWFSKRNFVDARARWDVGDDGPVLLLDVHPRKDLHAAQLVLEVHCLERTWVRRQNKRTNKDRELGTETYRLRAGTLEARTEHTLELPVRLPMELPGTFYSPKAKTRQGFAIVWTARARLEVEGVDWLRDWELEVGAQRLLTTEAKEPPFGREYPGH
jgi:hypothetical protein